MLEMVYCENSPLNDYVLFTDASLSPKLKLGVGGYLFLPGAFLKVNPDSINKPDVFEHLAVRRFTDTGSTQLEIQTVIWALEDCRNTLMISHHGDLPVYTDSQCVAGLSRRRSGLEKKNYISKQTNGLMANASLYRKFYTLYDELDIKIIKVAGHSRFSSHDTVHRIFSLVDREVRKALRCWMDELQKQGTVPQSSNDDTIL
jgi:ribonuclease HI